MNVLQPLLRKNLDQSQAKATRLLSTSFVFILFVLVCVSCGHDQVKDNPGHARRNVLAWSGKALIFDKVHDKKNTVSIDAISRRPRSMRMDIKATLGIYVGSLVWNDSQMQVLLAREKKFLSGPANADSMQTLLKMQLDPQALLDIFWNDPLPVREWSCVTDAVGGLVQSCKHKSLGITVVWQEREGRHRLIEVDSPKANVQLSIKELEEDVELKPSTFVLKAPESFQLISM